MKKIAYAAIITLSVLLLANCATAGLPGFGAEIGKTSSPMGDVRVPYTDVVNYFGYVEPGAAPDATVKGKKMYYVYVWIPVVAPEIGARMVSPVPDGMTPAESDFVAANFEKGAADKENYFDTWITVERANEVINPADITAKGPRATWTGYGSNDDSSELPANPGGQKYNSVLRIVSEPKNPTKALVRGLYRIGFTTYKKGEVKGSFLAQIGAPVAIPGVQIAKTLDELRKAVK